MDQASPELKPTISFSRENFTLFVMIPILMSGGKSRKILLSVPERLLSELDRMVSEGYARSRSELIRIAILRLVIDYKISKKGIQLVLGR